MAKKISGRSGAAASYNKKGEEFIFPHEDPKRIDAKRTLRGIKNPESVEEIAKDKRKLKARRAVKRISEKLNVEQANAGASVKPNRMTRS
jgi:hypothetical protein